MSRKKSSSNNNELTELIAAYEKANADNRPIYLDGDQLADIAEQYVIKDEFDKAQEAITYGLKLHPENTDLLLEQAYLYLDTQKIRLARDTVNRITEDFIMPVKLLKVEIMLHNGELEEIKTFLSTLTEEEENDLETIIDIAYLYMDMGYPTEAEYWILKGNELYSEDENMMNVSADCYYALHNLDKAELYYNKLIDLEPYNSNYWIGLAKCYFDAENYDKTIEACDFALAADEDAGEAYMFRAHGYFHLNNPDEAISNYKQAIFHNAMSPETGYMFMGLAYANKEEWALADECYQKSIDILEENKPEYTSLLVDIYTNKALTASYLDNYQEAHQLCKKAREISFKEDPSVFLIEGQIYLKENKQEKARLAFEKALQLSPTVETWYQIGLHYSNYDLFANAMICFEEVYKLDPKYEDVTDRLSILSLILSDVEKFFKYNEESEHPLDEATIQNALPDIEQSDTIKMLKEIQKRMRKENGNKK